MAIRAIQQAKRKDGAGFTLTEIMVAVAILAAVSGTVVSGMIFNSRAARLNANRLAAKNVAQGLIERMQADLFFNVGDPLNANHLVNPASAGAAADPTNYALTHVAIPNATNLRGYPNVLTTNTPPIYLDQALNIPCQVTFTFRGFGKATGGSTNSVSDATAAWTANEWVGDLVYIVNGIGSGQFAKVLSNTATTLTVANNAFFTAPTNLSYYMINNGKSMRVTTQWSYQGQNYTQTLNGLIINPSNKTPYGFYGI